MTLKQIVRSYPNGSDLEVLATTNVVNPDGIAIYWIGRNVYWTDAGANKIEYRDWTGLLEEASVQQTLTCRGL